jgi:hypothetical protein
MKICKDFNIKPCLYCEEDVYEKERYCEIAQNIIRIEHIINYCDDDLAERSLIKGYRFRQDNQCEIIYYMLALEQVSYHYHTWLSKIIILL